MITHKEFSNDFFAGYENAKTQIQQMGFLASRDKFNQENPIGAKPSSMPAYYYAKGEMQALIEHLCDC